MASNKGFIRYTKITIFFTIFVVFAGSMVKVTGSGMGCPDWPKCFGYYIPPFNAEKLEWKPNFDYHAGEMIFWEGDLLKADRDFKTNEVHNGSNWSIYDKHDYKIYKPMHTIIEYVNRLVSVLLGISVLLMIIFAFKSDRKRGVNVVVSLLALFLIGFNAWLGKLVVDNVLAPSSISYHMFAAFALVVTLSFAYTKNREKSSFTYPKLYKRIQVVAFIFLIYQLFFGVILRQTFDYLVGVSRGDWVNSAGLNFLVHRSSSLVYVALGFVTYRMLRYVPKDSFEWKNFKWVIICTIGEVISGAIMGYLDVPKAAQPFHVIVSSILLLVQSNLFFKIINKSTKYG